MNAKRVVSGMNTLEELFGTQFVDDIGYAKVVRKKSNHLICFMGSGPKGANDLFCLSLGNFLLLLLLLFLHPPLLKSHAQGQNPSKKALILALSIKPVARSILWSAVPLPCLSI